MLRIAILSLLSVLLLWYAFVFFRDFYKNRHELEGGNWFVLGVMGAITNFFDAIGIGSFAPLTTSGADSLLSTDVV